MDLVPIKFKGGIRDPRGVERGRFTFGFRPMGRFAKGAGPRGNFERAVEVG